MHKSSRHEMGKSMTQHLCRIEEGKIYWRMITVNAIQTPLTYNMCISQNRDIVSVVLVQPQVLVGIILWLGV